ncbi:hypothetical protein [Burkholderia metallica]|uniref:hypothetical protein n=1 Tax=Burkholderia metallica TaxID=488729 RepID=UPI001581E79F|nr:hypothetical protein [Burkholderia metallica]
MHTLRGAPISGRRYAIVVLLAKAEHPVGSHRTMLAGGPLGREQARAVPSPLDANATSACYPVPARRSCAVCRPPVHHVTSVTPRRNASRVRASMPVPGRRTESHARRLGPRARPVSGHAGRLPVLTQSRFDRAAIFRFFTPGFGRDRPPPTHADATAGRGISLVSAAAGARARFRHKCAVCASQTRSGCRTGNFVGAICGARRFTISFIGTASAVAATRRPPNGDPRGTQRIMLRGRPKTVDSYRAGGPNRDKPHFGGA